MTIHLPLPILTPDETARFWSLVAGGAPDACWLWRGTRTTDTYGRFKVRGRTVMAHRMALFLTTGNDPGPHVSMHACDTPACCNPAHLVGGTYRQNAHDAKAKGRLRAGVGERHGSRTHPERWARGERVGGAKLTAAAVEDIRRRYAAGGVTHAALAERYGVRRETVSSVLRGVNWHHLTVDRAVTLEIGRANRSHVGERNAAARLTAEHVREIRRLHAEGVATSVLATRYGVSVPLIHAIRKRRVWKHLD